MPVRPFFIDFSTFHVKHLSFYDKYKSAVRGNNLAISPQSINRINRINGNIGHGIGHAVNLRKCAALCFRFEKLFQHGYGIVQVFF